MKKVKIYCNAITNLSRIN